MLVKIFKDIFGSKNKKSQNKNFDLEKNFSQALDFYNQSRPREALEILHQCLEQQPDHVPALTTKGACLADMGNLQEAAQAFELAYSLDDTYWPAVVNNAKFLVDKKQSRDALPFLRRGRVINSEIASVYNLYATLCHFLAKTDEARYFHLRAWLATFEHLRIANGYLFHTSYADISERELAAEHRFWAETVHPCNFDLMPLQTEKKREKIRIGYWSPDFRVHSVRYFFRPLLENHNKQKFEVFLYHDFFQSDEQTDLIKNYADKFHNVYELQDKDLCDLMRSHQLDILVELAGHTSSNRLFLLQERLATLQVTGLGYPPTTGLSTIDAKLLDIHLITPNYKKFYAEKPMVLPSSFWCFDPIEDDPAFLADVPPLLRNGYVTFGCVGNIAKINNKILICWREILRRVPRSRLLIRSVSFEDVDSEIAVNLHYKSIGLPMDRVILHKPARGKDYFESYNEIDIILDTTPFNGGTTTCFAVYMGVPVVTWAGESLISRMGLSIMSNVGAANIAVTNADDYIRCAVNLSQDVNFLCKFKKEARQRMKKSALGNGKIFAQDFEDACINALQEKINGTWSHQQDIDILPANEIVRRAYSVLRRGQRDAAERILNHCLKYYPNCGSAHIMATHAMTEKKKFSEAVEYLEKRCDQFSIEEQIAAWINITRCHLLDGKFNEAVKSARKLKAYQINNDFEKTQIALISANLLEKDIIRQNVPVSIAANGQIHCVIFCNEAARFHLIQKKIKNTCFLPSGWSVSFSQYKESDKISAYKEVQQEKDIEIFVFIQKNIDIYRSDFFFNVIYGLQSVDVLGFAGATCWDRLDWNSSPFVKKTGVLLNLSQEKEGWFEIIMQGILSKKLQTDLVVLDGHLLAAKKSALLKAEFNSEFEGAGVMLEQYWTNSIQNAGGILGVHHQLGVLLHPNIELHSPHWADVRLEIASQKEFDVLAMQEEDYSTVSWLVSSEEEATTTTDRFIHELL